MNFNRVTPERLMKQKRRIMDAQQKVELETMYYNEMFSKYQMENPYMFQQQLPPPPKENNENTDHKIA